MQAFQHVKNLQLIKSLGNSSEKSLRRPSLPKSKALLAFVSLIFTANLASAHSRGPYFPAKVSVPGTLMDQWDPSEYSSQEIDASGTHAEAVSRDGRPFGLTGVFVLVKTLVGFELGYAVYSCREIDDGAYGAMSCAQAASPSYLTLQRFSSCPTPAPRAAGCQ